MECYATIDFCVKHDKYLIISIVNYVVGRTYVVVRHFYDFLYNYGTDFSYYFFLRPFLID